MTINTRIVLHKLELNIHLGWPEKERSQQQLVYLDIEIIFADPPNACLSDDLHETYNYEILSLLLEETISQRTFRLIEHLGYETYQLIKKTLPKNSLLNICVTKNPPIPKLNNGVSFWYGDKL